MTHQPELSMIPPCSPARPPFFPHWQILKTKNSLVGLLAAKPSIVGELFGAFDDAHIAVRDACQVLSAQGSLPGMLGLRPGLIGEMCSAFTVAGVGREGACRVLSGRSGLSAMLADRMALVGVLYASFKTADVSVEDASTFFCSELPAKIRLIASNPDFVATLHATFTGAGMPGSVATDVLSSTPRVTALCQVFAPDLKSIERVKSAVDVAAGNGLTAVDVVRAVSAHTTAESRGWSGRWSGWECCAPRGFCDGLFENVHISST